MLRLVIWLALVVGGNAALLAHERGPAVEARRDLYLRQFDGDDAVPAAIRRERDERIVLYAGFNAGAVLFGVALLSPRGRKS